MTTIINEGAAASLGGTYLFPSPADIAVLDDGRIFFNSNFAGNSSFDYADLMFSSGSISALMTDGDTLPNGASTSLRTFATVSAGNYVGYIAQLSGGQPSYWVHDKSNGTDTRIAANGDASPGISGGSLRLLGANQVNMNAAGQAVFLATVVATPNNYGAIYLWDPSTGLHLIAKTGDVEPATGATITAFSLNPLGPAPINSSGQVLFVAFLSNGKSGLFVYSIAGEVGKVYVGGDTDAGGHTFTSSIFPTTAQINDAGQVAFEANTSAATQAPFIATPGGTPQEVGPLPNSTVIPFITDLSFNNNGYAAFYWEDQLVVASTSSAQVIASTGANAPLSAGGGTFNFLSAFNDAFITGNNDVLFRSALNNAEGTSGYFYWHSGSNSIDTILLQGQAVPGMPGWFFTDVLGSGNAVANMGGNASGDVFLTTTVTGSGGSGIEAMFRYRPSTKLLEKIASRAEVDPNSGAVLTQAIMRGLSGSRAQAEPAFWGMVSSGTYSDAIFTVAPISANLSLAAQPPSSPFVLGMTSPVTFTVTNNGSSIASGITFSMTLPSGVVLGSSPGTCTGTTTITCTLDNLDVGVSENVSVPVIVSSIPSGSSTTTVDFTGSVSANETSGPVTATNTVTVQRQTVTSSFVSFTAGGAANVSFVVSNDTGAAETNVVVTITVPAGYTATGLPGGCTQSGTTVTCLIGTLAAQASTT
ncbi:MAG: choice-of-anchor tandem repeat NxxGxxAF-containing protein, partial [Terriglobales bacterium]